MKNSVLLSALLMIMLFATGSCRMHYERAPRVYGGDGYRANRHKFGNGKHHSVRKAYWGKKRYGPRPHDFRGKYH